MFVCVLLLLSDWYNKFVTLPLNIFSIYPMGSVFVLESLRNSSPPSIRAFFFFTYKYCHLNERTCVKKHLIELIRINSIWMKNSKPRWIEERVWEMAKKVSSIRHIETTKTKPKMNKIYQEITEIQNVNNKIIT